MSINIKSRDQLVGQQVPNVTFHTRVADSWKDVTTDELFKGKKVVVFALPFQPPAALQRAGSCI